MTLETLNIETDPGKSAQVIDGKIVFIEVAHDENPMHPLKDCDGMGMIYSFNRRHVDSIDSQAELDTLLESNPYYVPLSYYEHGNCAWGVMGELEKVPGVEMQWDGIGFAGIWVPDKCLIEDIEERPEAERKARRYELAAQACNVYTSWCNGDVYGYRWEVYPIMNDGEGEPMIDEDSWDVYERMSQAVGEGSCWGFFGPDLKYMVDEMSAEILNTLSEKE